MSWTPKLNKHFSSNFELVPKDISDNIDRCFLKPIFAPSGVSTGHIYPQEEP